MSFKLAVTKVLDHEGGFVNHPLDPGGATNWGITKRTYERYLGRTVTIEEMRNMPKSHAEAIYKKDYWDAIGGDSIKFYSIAFALFDQAVNRGVPTVIKQAQKILGVSADGNMGPKTLAALNAAGETDFLSKFISASLGSYEAIAAKNPSSAVFLYGWKNRINSLSDYVAGVAGQANVGTVASLGAVFLLVGLFFIFTMARAKA